MSKVDQGKESRPLDGRCLCPEKHSDLRQRPGPMAYCEACKHAYRQEDLLDLSEVARQGGADIVSEPVIGRA